MPPFLPRPEHELERFDDEALIAHMRAARDAGDRGQARLALHVLVHGHWDRVERRVAMRVPPEDVEAVTSNVVFSAVSSAFDGSSVGEFHKWLNTILERRVADYYRHREGEPRVVALAVGDATAADEHVIADTRQDVMIELNDALERVLADMSPVHARAAERHVLQGFPARVVAAELDLTENNVAQIASRFRKRLRSQLEPEISS